MERKMACESDETVLGKGKVRRLGERKGTAYLGEKKKVMHREEGIS